MFTREQAIEMAQANAEMAWDQRNDPSYPTKMDVVYSYRDNVRDTLNEEGSSEWDADARAAFDTRIIRLSGGFFNF